MTTSTDHSPDTSLADETPETPIKGPDLATAAVETILSLDEVLSSARLVETKAKICLRADLEAEYADIMSELATLVDDEGNVVADDDSLADQKVQRAHELQRLAEENRKVRAEHVRVVRFRAMPSDEWEAFEKANRQGGDGRGPAKNPLEYERKIISRCAIEPTLTEEQVRDLKGKLGPAQMDHLFAKAYEACRTGGLDVPKSLPFSLAPRQ